MNIIEAYIKFRNQLVILISGISGSGITELGDNMKRDTKLKLVSYKDYMKKENDVEKVDIIIDGDIKKVPNWDSRNAVKWQDFINDINANKKTGVIAVCPSFPKAQYENLFSADFHINIKLPKQNILKKRLEYNKSHDNMQMDENILMAIFNRYTFPYYLYSIDPANSIITKFIDASKYADSADYNNTIYDEAFDYIMTMINRWLADNVKTQSAEKKKDTDSDFHIISTESATPDAKEDDDDTDDD